MVLDMWNVAEPLEVGYRQPVHQSNDQNNNDKKGKDKQPFTSEIEGQGGIANQMDSS